MSRKKERFWVMLEPNTATALEQWCEKQRREIPFTLRCIVETFLNEGIDEAERRLVEGFPASAQNQPSTGIPGSTPAERGEYIVTGKQPNDARDKRKPA